jgi:hypothetical protein
LGSWPIEPWNFVAAPSGERLAHDQLGLARRIHVGRVDEVDPGVERAMNDADRLVVVALAPRAEHHRAEAQRADANAGVREGARLHRADTLLPAPHRRRAALTRGLRDVGTARAAS